VFGKRFEHVVEKLDVGVDLDRSAVESEAQIDLRFFGRALDDRAAFAQLSAPTGFPFAPLWRWEIGVDGWTSGPV
jgi:hypothetical protein